MRDVEDRERLGGENQTALKERIEELENEAALEVAEKLNRQNGIIVRQRLTIQEQSQTIKELRDQVTFLKDKIADLHHQLVEAKEGDASSGNR